MQQRAMCLAKETCDASPERHGKARLEWNDSVGREQRVGSRTFARVVSASVGRISLGMSGSRARTQRSLQGSQNMQMPRRFLRRSEAQKGCIPQREVLVQCMSRRMFHPLTG